MIKVAYVNTGYGDTKIEEQHLNAAGVLFSNHKGLAEDQIAAAIQDADALVVTLQKVNADLINSLPNLKVIVRMGVGVDSVDIAAASKRNIPVINIPDYCIEEVALQAASLILAAHRKLVPANRLVKDRRWQDSAQLKPIHALSSLTLGLLGMGRIGIQVIDYMKAFVGRIIVSDPFLKQEQLPEGVQLVTIGQLWDQTDILSIHCPLTEDTKYMINRETIPRMSRKPIVVNVSRGPIIHEGDLLDGLNKGLIRYAALDVLEQEPPQSDHPLLDHPQALITSHLAWYSVEAEIRLREMSVTRAIDYLQGRSVPTIVNRSQIGAR